MDRLPGALITIAAVCMLASAALILMSALGVGEYDSPPDPPSVECATTSIPAAPVCEPATP